MTVSIREATVADYDALCELFDEVDRLHRDHLPYIFQKPKGPVREKDYYRGLISDENIGLFIAEIDEAVIGFIHAVVQSSPGFPVFIPRRIVIVDSLAVNSAFQKQGIGQQLMSAVYKWAAAKGVTAVELNVYEFNETAIAFYKKLGYETLSRRMSRTLESG